MMDVLTHPRLSGPGRYQAEIDALMREAAEDYPPSPDRAQRHNVVLLIQGLYFITGSMLWHRGWVRALQCELGHAGCSIPTAAVCRWIRSQCTYASPWIELAEGVSPDFLNDMALLGRIADD
tara:strand:+ start:6021 stop:6386 length:366 start_codon:yes stop_codon:yes gene_type:complete